MRWVVRLGLALVLLGLRLLWLCVVLGGAGGGVMVVVMAIIHLGGHTLAFDGDGIFP